MNGAQSLFKALTDAGLDTCFANPGTSEMQLVYEMGKTDTVRPVLCLQENVVTGAADGYARMKGDPAFTLLHVGSGFANGIANLHNAGRGNIPIVNIVGANASYHQANYPEHEFIAGRISDIAGPVSHWVREARSSREMGALGVEAVQQARSGGGRISTLIAPTNCHWDPAPAPPVAKSSPQRPEVAVEVILGAAERLSNGRKTAILLGSDALQRDTLELAGRVAEKTGAQLLAETFPARMPRGEGQVQVQLVPYVLEFAAAFLAEYEQLILVGALPPVATFAYEGAATKKAPPTCETWAFATAEQAIHEGLVGLIDTLGAADREPIRQPRIASETPHGSLTPTAIGQSLNRKLPENAILVDESTTAGLEIFEHTKSASTHDYLYAIPGGAIGNGLPVALGAAIACPDRKVIVLQADGSGMYTNQALWSMARENCNIVIVVLKNDAYAVLNVELARVRKGKTTPRTQSMLEIDQPSIDWVRLGESMGVPSVAASTAESFEDAFEKALLIQGPMLIEASIEQNLQPIIDLLAGQN